MNSLSAAAAEGASMAARSNNASYRKAEHNDGGFAPPAALDTKAIENLQRDIRSPHIAASGVQLPVNTVTVSNDFNRFISQMTAAPVPSASNATGAINSQQQGHATGPANTVQTGSASQPKLGPVPVNKKQKRIPKSDLQRSERQKAQKLEPSVVSFSSYISGDSSSKAANDEALSLAQKDPDWAKMTPAECRRHERNMREQQRSGLISQQIKELREVLTESNIPFKPNKFSILVSVVDYIKSLQARAIMLDSEHQKLADTIREASDLVTNGLTSEEDKECMSPLSDEPQSELLFVQGIDYRAVFNHCPYAMGVASLDGRILVCNSSFESLLGLNKDRARQQSFFVFIRNHQDIFDAMADLLKRSSVASETGEGVVVKEEHLLYWCGQVVTLRSQRLIFNITLTSSSNGEPSFFGFSAAEGSHDYC
ncbi:predicted protein [Phaeodactylum tricornutum CCAP 1055/1]|uniref:BHLH domain-containing protein n=1 Tax=Phaeodactylum tricornutum (strain CCAP 1055/1) TaxID=556484 RepID=B7FV24_PHATC|nr:predicted protein [Phaeodactylum tricornutum CCAP 1055/1]EEC49546.1 predicted protein [Phaeodactylum tricornutum CCAP 1055/1]|eukprot:XP_002178848.1 predicted protein [Phaeodactylum tricornutum CCAP 1055/1]